MKISEERIANVLIVGLSGRMDTINALSLEKTLNQAIDGGERKLVLFLAQLEYMSSSGLRAILGLAKRLDHEGGAFALSCPSPVIRELIQIAHLDQLIPIYNSNGEAALALSRKSSGSKE